MRALPYKTPILGLRELPLHHLAASHCPFALTPLLLVLVHSSWMETELCQQLQALAWPL